MKYKTILSALVVVVAAAMAVQTADAARFGGGRSLGVQRNSIAPPSMAPRAPAVPGGATNPVMPAQPQAAVPRAAAPAAPAAAPARSGMSRWLGPIAGLAAGLGLAALLSHFGLSEGFAGLLLLALIVFAGIFVLRAIFARRASGMQYAGASAGPRGPVTAPRAEVDWGRPERVEPALGATSNASRRIPPGFDVDGFLRHARTQFNAIQSAWDAGDRRTLSNVTTPEMYEEIVRDLATRGAHVNTLVVRLDADLLEVVTEGAQHWASVRFFGLLREDGADAPKPFDEIWNLAKPVDGSSGWLVAGIQQNETALAAH